MQKFWQKFWLKAVCTALAMAFLAGGAGWLTYILMHASRGTVESSAPAAPTKPGEEPAASGGEPAKTADAPDKSDAAGNPAAPEGTAASDPQKDAPQGGHTVGESSAPAAPAKPERDPADAAKSSTAPGEKTASVPEKGASASGALSSGKSSGNAPSDDAGLRPDAAFIALAEGRGPSPAPVTPEEKARASLLLDFCNDAERTAFGPWYRQADVLDFYTRIYLGEWKLPKRGEPDSSRAAASRRLMPPAGLFTDEERGRIAGHGEAMGKALEGMIADYKALEAYVADPTIIDDGKKGKELAAAIAKGYARFCASRTALLSLLDERAVVAEDVFLADNPLRRQILCARRIFRLYRQIAEILTPKPAQEPPAAADPLAGAADAPASQPDGNAAKTEEGAPGATPPRVDRAALAAMERELRAVAAYAAEPPFRGKPLDERAYRAFLKEVAAYDAMLARGLAEGFFMPLRKAMNDLAATSRETYNAFVEGMNSR